MKQKELLTILVPLFILTILWVLFNIYHNHVTSTIKDPLNIQIIPIEGNFDNETINKIKDRQRIDPLYEIQNQADENPTPTTTIRQNSKPASNSAETVNQEQNLSNI